MKSKYNKKCIICGNKVELSTIVPDIDRTCYTVEIQWLKHLWNHEICSRQK